MSNPNAIGSDPFYYDSLYSGAEVDEAVGRAVHGGELDVTIAAVNNQVNANRNLLEIVKNEVFDSNDNSIVDAINVMAQQASSNATEALAKANAATSRVNDPTTGLAAIWSAINRGDVAVEAGSYTGDGTSNCEFISQTAIMAFACFIGVEGSSEQVYLLQPIILGGFTHHVVYYDPSGDPHIYHGNCGIGMNDTATRTRVTLSSDNQQMGPRIAMNTSGVTYTYFLIGSNLGT